MKVIAQHCIGTTQEWLQANPKLYEAVWGFEKTTDGKIFAKLGNGTNRWNDLKYFDMENIHGLPEKLQEDLNQALQAVEEEARARHEADQILQEQIDDLMPEGIANEAEERQEADLALQQAIDNAVQALNEAIANEAEARQEADLALQQATEEAIDNEAEAREQGDVNTLNSAKNHTDESISQTNDNLQDLKRNFDAWNGRGGYLDAYDFGTPAPEQIDLTNYALSQIPSISSPEEIWNGTKVINLYNNHLWIITNTQDTVPVVLEWNDQGPGDLTSFGTNSGGYIVGGDSNIDGPEYVYSQPNGKGKIDLQTIIDMLFDKEHPVGDVVTQMPGAPSPIDKQWRGDWRKWNDRATQYRLRQTPIPAYTTYTPGVNYAANAVVMWHLPGDDYAFFKAKAAITSAAEQLDPIKWDQLKEGVVVNRKDMLNVNPWIDNDLVIGQQITGGEYDGYFIEEVIVYGGKFSSYDGGNRPLYESGTAPDVIRNIYGSANYTTSANGGIGANGAFTVSGSYYWAAPATNALVPNTLAFNASLVVPTGLEFGGRTFSELVWLRIS